MGYTTDFTGRFILSKKLTKAQANYLLKFACTRRMKRDEAVAHGMGDASRIAVKLPMGDEAGYFTGGEGYEPVQHDRGILDHNNPPKGQPGLWCSWVPTEDRKGIEWNGSEKFYHYVEWINYIKEHFLDTWGIALSGSVKYQGEDPADAGWLVVGIGGKVEQRGKSETLDMPEVPEKPRAKWRAEVAGQKTELGYWEWVEA